jgi:arylsulfatase A-like enzyme
LRANGVSFKHHYPITAACAPSRSALPTGHHPSLHGVSQTDGLTKSAEGDDVFWLAPDAVPTLGDWFRAGGYRTFFKGKWHASHAHLDADDGKGFLLSIDDDGKPQEENIKRYLKADLLDEVGFSESMIDLWGTIPAPQPWIETHLKFYYQQQATVDEQITRVLDALAASGAYENTIVVFSSDHGDLQGSHNGMHEKWHVSTPRRCVTNRSVVSHSIEAG